MIWSYWWPTIFARTRPTLRWRLQPMRSGATWGLTASSGTGRMPTYNRTIYRGVSYVACGQTVSTNGDGNLEQSAFWHPPVGNRIRYRTDADYEEHLLHL